MKKTLLSIMTCLIITLLLVSCGDKGADIPEGLQIIEISEEHGFKFYGPENWVIVNSRVDTDKEVWGAKMTSVNNISITLAKADMPENDINTYFAESIAQFPASMECHVVTLPTLANFGNADEAYRCVYTYKYESYSFACMQYLIKNDGDFYIFTYTSYGDVTDESSDYNIYYDKVELAVSKFLFTDKSEVSRDVPEYETDSEGYKLVSDPKISGFELYIPEDTEVIVSDAYVTVKLSDGASIYLGKATSTGIEINAYWKNRKSELERIATEVTEIEVNKINKEGEEASVVLGDLTKVASYEYTYVFGGTKCHVYQVMGVDFFNGYVFTYTAAEDEYASHLDTVKKIIEKVRF